MHQSGSKVEIYESPEFIEAATQYLSEHELGALRHYLAANPSMGVPVEEWPGLQVLEWRLDPPVNVLYMASEKRPFIALVAILGPEDAMPAPTSTEGKQAKGILEDIKKIGIGLIVRDVYEWLKQFL